MSDYCKADCNDCKNPFQVCEEVILPSTKIIVFYFKTEWQQYHKAIQTFKSIHNSSPLCTFASVLLNAPVVLLQKLLLCFNLRYHILVSYALVYSVFCLLVDFFLLCHCTCVSLCFVFLCSILYTG